MPVPAPHGWLEECLRRVATARVAVFGDFCLDAYWLIDPDEGELSVETCLPLRRVRQQRYSLGGAGNVVANLVDLGVAKLWAIGLIGRDLFGRELLELLAERGVDTRGLLQCQDDWQTMVYAKPCVGGVEQNRFDFGGFNVIRREAIELLREELEHAAAEADAVVLNQQVPQGVSTPEMIEQINGVIGRHPGRAFIVDSRHRAGLYRGGMLKLNDREAARLCGAPLGQQERVQPGETRRFAARLRKHAGRPVFVTCGEEGIVVADSEGEEWVPGIEVLGLTDPVGAGDTVVAVLAAVIRSGSDCRRAARLANIAASVTVRKIGTTGTATPDEIRRIGADPPYICLPELADEPALARYLNGTAIETVCELPSPLEIRHAVFDHDGTISTLRQGWQSVMESVMVRAILGGGADEVSDAPRQRVTEQVRTFIDRTTGVQTLAQMEGLVTLVRQFGRVPGEAVLDAHGYKRLYDAQILAVVRERIARLRGGQVAPSDFVVAGAQEFLESLHGRGVKLYLVSGTDTPEVRAEAETLGYAHLFEGRIYGAVGKAEVEPKRLVLQDVLREHRPSASQVVVFGDGPVEMREARRRGALPVGVASDEIKRQGLNAAKRSRLIRAGADLIIPDFIQREPLLRLLGLGG